MGRKDSRIVAGAYYRAEHIVTCTADLWQSCGQTNKINECMASDKSVCESVKE